MNRNKIETLFNHINSVLDEINEIEISSLYEYIEYCITNDQRCNIEDYKEFTEN